MVHIAGYIKLYRDIREHWIYKDAEYYKVWNEMLLCARYLNEPKTDSYHGINYTLNYGEFVFGRPSWSKRLGISEQRLKTLVKKLETDQMIVNQKSYSKFTIYLIKNYQKYNHQSNQQETQENEDTQNDSNQQDNQQLTSNQPATNQQLTTIKKVKKERRKEEDIKDIMHGAINPPCQNPAFITLTLNDKFEYPIYQAQVDNWKELYQSVDITQELKKMKGWLNANPTKRKTKTGILRFVNSWLSKEQDKAPASSKSTQQMTTAQRKDAELQEALRRAHEEGGGNIDY